MGILPVASLGVLVLLVALAPYTSGQADPIQLEMTPATDEITLQPEENTSIMVNASNNGALDGDVTLTIQEPPQGWTVEARPNTFHLPAGETERVILGIGAPDRTHGIEEPIRVVLEGTLTDASGQFQSEDRVEVDLMMETPSPSTIQRSSVTPSTEPLLWFAGATVVIGILGGVGIVHQRQRRSAPFGVRAGEFSSTPGFSEYHVSLDVTNLTTNLIDASLSVLDAPEDVIYGFSRDHLSFRGDDRKRVWLAVMPVDGQRLPQGQLVVRVQPHDDREPCSEIVIPLDAPPVGS